MLLRMSASSLSLQKSRRLLTVSEGRRCPYNRYHPFLRRLIVNTKTPPAPPNTPTRGHARGLAISQRTSCAPGHDLVRRRTHLLLLLFQRGRWCQHPSTLCPQRFGRHTGAITRSITSARSITIEASIGKIPSDHRNQREAPEEQASAV